MDILNPVGARNPNQITGEGGKMSAEQVEQKEEYIEGGQYIPLPSKGVFYNWDAKYIGLDKLKVRELNYTDEDILTTKSYLDDGSVFLELLKNVIIDSNGFHANGLVPIDRDTILLWLRSTSFGNIFEAKTNCPNCKAPINLKWDLSTFKIPEYDSETLENLVTNNGEYVFETPLKNLKVHIAVPNLGKSKEFEKSLEAKKKNSKTKTDLFGVGSIMLIITAIVDETGRVIRNKNEIQNYFNKITLPIIDARYIRKQLEKIALSYDTKQDVTCPECEYVQEDVEMPMLHPNFFWPDTGI